MIYTISLNVSSLFCDSRPSTLASLVHGERVSERVSTAFTYGPSCTLAVQLSNLYLAIPPPPMLSGGVPFPAPGAGDSKKGCDETPALPSRFLRLRRTNRDGRHITQQVSERNSARRSWKPASQATVRCPTWESKGAWRQGRWKAAWASRAFRSVRRVFRGDRRRGGGGGPVDGA